MAQALYYPWIDIIDEAWLKTAFLYWDSVRTIVPESIEVPYSTNAGQALQDIEFLVPLRVHPNMEEIEDLTEDVMTYLGTVEGALMLTGARSPGHHIHLDKLPYELSRLADIHPQKLPYAIKNLLEDFMSPSMRGHDYLRVSDKFANYYMTLLATRLAERIGAQLLTPLPSAARLAVTARFDAQLNEVLHRAMNLHRRNWREYEAYGPRQRMPKDLASGMLANLSIERIGVPANTPIERLIKFRESHNDELTLFRKKIEQLVASVEEDLPIEALRQRITNLYTEEVVPAISNLKAALKGKRIKWLSDGLLKIAFLSAGSSTMLVMTGLDVPTALLAGAGISLIAAGATYNVDKQESLRSNPFAYLLSMEKLA